MRPPSSRLPKQTFPRWRVAVLAAQGEAVATVTRAVTEAGGHVVIEAPPRVDSLNLVPAAAPDVIILHSATVDGRRPDLMPFTSAGRPVVLFSQDTSPALLKVAARSGISAFLLDPLRPAQLAPTLDLAVARFADSDRLRRRLAERKLVERAKGRLMATRGHTEDEAFRWLRTRSMQTRSSLADVARQVIEENGDAEVTTPSAAADATSPPPASVTRRRPRSSSVRVPPAAGLARPFALGAARCAAISTPRRGRSSATRSSPATSRAALLRPVPRISRSTRATSARYSSPSPTGRPAATAIPDSRVFQVAKLTADVNATQQSGGLYKIRADSKDGTGLTFTWARLEQGGEAGAVGCAGFAAVDNLVFDDRGNVWGVTDMSTGLHNGFTDGLPNNPTTISHTADRRREHVHRRVRQQLDVLRADLGARRRRHHPVRHRPHALRDDRADLRRATRSSSRSSTPARTATICSRRSPSTATSRCSTSTGVSSPRTAR